MLEKLKNLPDLRKHANVQNAGLILLGIIMLSVSWSSTKVIQKNTKLELEAQRLDQQIAVVELQVKTKKLKNEFLKSEEFQQLQARRLLGVAAPGEKVYIVPDDVAARYAPKAEDLATAQNSEESTNQPGFLKNWTSWYNFFMNHKPES